MRPLPRGTIIYVNVKCDRSAQWLVSEYDSVTNQACSGQFFPGKSLQRDSFLYWWLGAIRQPVLALARSQHVRVNTELRRRYARLAGRFSRPLDEQHAIVAFLDRETERIDALVERKRRLIERLREYRTALITRTVTRGMPPEAARAAGLDSSPRMKPSGVGVARRRAGALGGKAFAQPCLVSRRCNSKQGTGRVLGRRHSLGIAQRYEAGRHRRLGRPRDHCCGRRISNHNAAVGHRASRRTGDDPGSLVPCSRHYGTSHNQPGHEGSLQPASAVAYIPLLVPGRDRSSHCVAVR